jgi:glycosyltransferase involved in cell wall biosynthesis
MAPEPGMKVVLVANTAWYLFNHRISLAKALKERGAELVLISPQDEFSRRLVAQGFDWRPISMTRRGINPFMEFYSFRQLVRMYREIRPDVVHHFTTKPVIYGSLAARRSGVPSVINAITGLGYIFIREGWLGNLLRVLAGILYRFSLNHSSIQVVFQNSTDRSLFVTSNWVRPEQTALIPGSGVDTRRFVPAPEPKQSRIVLLVGRMLWDKGVAEFTEAARILKARGAEAEFHLVGGTDSGNPAAIPESTLRQWTDEGTIRWLGRMEDMPQVYAGSTLVVLPSYREGLPRTLIEAAAVGRAIVASDIPGCRDIVQQGVNGLLVPPRDPVSLADAIEELLGKPALRKEMGRAGRKMVEDEFSNQKIVKATLELYHLQSRNDEPSE